jgi:hypothetical protein
VRRCEGRRGDFSGVGAVLGRCATRNLWRAWIGCLEMIWIPVACQLAFLEPGA